jgi:RNA polymerase sigma-70 factor (ECF subfamily)
VSDRELVARLLRGDALAFESFFAAYSSALYRFAMPRVGYDAAAAEEVVQAALALAVRKLATFRGEAALLTWLCTFCRHEISAYFERARRHPARVSLSEDHPEVRAALESLAHEAESPEQALLQKEVARRVHGVLDALPRHYADALEWKYLEGMSVNEIAARLELSAKAAESLLTRAREAFRDGFAAQLDVAGAARP